MTRLQLYDQETREELGEIGIGVEEDVHACSECRFVLGMNRPEFARCGARGGRYIEHLNPHCNCPHWRAKPPAIREASNVQRSNKLGVGLSVVGILLSLAAIALALM